MVWERWFFLGESDGPTLKEKEELEIKKIKNKWCIEQQENILRCHSCVRFFLSSYHSCIYKLPLHIFWSHYIVTSYHYIKVNFEIFGDLKAIGGPNYNWLDLRFLVIPFLSRFKLNNRSLLSLPSLFSHLISALFL